jgi:hypothetical protein
MISISITSHLQRNWAGSNLNLKCLTSSTTLFLVPDNFPLSLSSLSHSRRVRSNFPFVPHTLARLRVKSEITRQSNEPCNKLGEKVIRSNTQWRKLYPVSTTPTSGGTLWSWRDFEELRLSLRTILDCGAKSSEFGHIRRRRRETPGGPVLCLLFWTFNAVFPPQQLWRYFVIPCHAFMFMGPSSSSLLHLSWRKILQHL